MKKVKVTFPDGSVGEVDEKDLSAALAAGAKLFENGAAKTRRVVFADGSEGDIDEKDYASALSMGAIKKKEPSGILSPTGVSPSGPGILESTPKIAALAPEVSKNPYGKIISAMSNADIPQDRRTMVYDEAVRNKNLQPLIDIVREEKEKIVAKKAKYNINKNEQASADLTGASDLLLATKIPDSDETFKGDDDRLKSMQKDAADAIDFIMGERFSNGEFTDAKIAGNELRKLKSEVEQEPGYVDQAGIVDYQKKLKNGTLFGYDINKARNQQEADYMNEMEIYNASLRRLGERNDELVTNPAVQKYLSGNEQERAQLRDDPDVKEFISVNKAGADMYQQMSSAIAKYPEVLPLIERAEIKKAWGEIVQGEREGPRIKFSPFDIGVIRQIKNLFSGNKPDTDEEYQILSDMTGIDKERVKEISKSKDFDSMVDPVGVPSYLGSLWRSTYGVFRSTAQGLNRTFMDKDAANLVNKEIEVQKYHKPEALSRSWNVDRVFETMADVTGQVAGYALTTGGIGTIPKMAAAAVARQVPSIAVRTEFLSAINKAVNTGSTFTTGFMSSLEQAYQYAATQTDDEDKRWGYAKNVAAANGVSELLLKDVDIANKILKGKSPLKVLQDFSAMRTPFSAGDVFKARMADLAKVVGYESAEELIPYVVETISKDNMFGYKTSTEEFFQGAFDTVVETAIGTLPIGGLSASRTIGTTGFTKAALLEAAKTPGYFKGKFDEMFEQGKITEKVRDRNIRIVNTLGDIYNKLPDAKPNGEVFTDSEMSDLVSRQLALRLLKNSKETTDESLHPAIDKSIKEVQTGIDELITKQESPIVEAAVIDINGVTYEGRNHAEAILKAQEDGQDISNTNRQADGKFRLSDGSIIDREEALARFGQDRAENLIQQDDASRKANELLSASQKKIETPEEKVINLVNAGAVLGGAEMAIKADPSQATEALRFIAQQAYGITETGEKAVGGVAEIENKEALAAAKERFPTPESTLQQQAPKKQLPDVESKKADIEKRRQEELERVRPQVDSVPNWKALGFKDDFKNLLQTGNTIKALQERYKKEPSEELLNALNTLVEFHNKGLESRESQTKSINEKYDAELAELEKQSTTQNVTQETVQNIPTTRQEKVSQEKAGAAVIQPSTTPQNVQTRRGVTVMTPQTEMDRFVDRMAKGEVLSTPEDLQFYQNNATEIESKLKDRLREEAEEEVVSDTPEDAERKRISDALFAFADKIEKLNITGAGGTAAMTDIFKIPQWVLGKAIRAVATAFKAGELFSDAIQKGIDIIRGEGHQIDKDDFIGLVNSVSRGEKPKMGTAAARAITIDQNVPSDQEYMAAMNEDEPSDPIASYHMTRGADLPQAFGADLTQQAVFDSLPSDERFRTQAQMLQDGKALIAAAQSMFGSTDVTVYGPQLFRYIKQMPHRDAGLTNKKAVLLAMLLGEIKQAMHSYADTSGLPELDNQVSREYNRFMHVTAKNLAAGRLLRLFRDKYMADIFADKILEEREIRERNLTKEAEGDVNISDQDAEAHQDKPRPKPDTKAAAERRERKKKEAAQRPKAPKSVYEKRAQEKEQDIKDKYGGKDALINKIIEKIKKLNCK